jgi:hypothetical protein
MLESDLLAALAGVYTAVSSTPQVVAPENGIGVTMMGVDVLASEDGEDPPIAHMENVIYFVLNKGQDTEQAFLSDQIAVDSIAAVRQSAANVKVKGGGILGGPVKVG